MRIQQMFHDDIDRIINNHLRPIELTSSQGVVLAYLLNLGLSLVFSGQKEEGLRYLSKAGELGLYDAYSVMKQF